MSQFSDERAAELKQLFFETALELLQSLNDETLKLEKKPGDLETVRTIRRIVHTLKGDSAAVGYHELSELAHELEDVIGDFQKLTQKELPGINAGLKKKRAEAISVLAEADWQKKREAEGSSGAGPGMLRFGEAREID